MKSRSLSSICSTVNSNRHDTTKQPCSTTLNQTSIRNFFIKTAKSSKRPLSASSSLTSTRSSIVTGSQPCSDDGSMSLPLTIIPNENSNCNHRNESSNRSVSSGPEITRLKHTALQVLNDSTMSHINADKRQKLMSTTISSRQSNSQKSKQQQLYIDFGQRNFAATNICPICGMLYVHGVQSDIKQHEKMCDNYQHGVLWSCTTATTKRSIPNEHYYNPNKPQRICYEWTVPRTKTKLQKNSANHITSSTNKNINIGNGWTSDEWQRASIVEVSYCYLFFFQH